MHSLLNLVDKATQEVTFSKVFKQDILTWLAVAMVGALLNIGLVGLVLIATGVDSEAARANAKLVLSGYPFLIIGFIACLALIQAKDWRLWTLYILTLFVVNLNGLNSLINQKLDLSYLNFIVTAIALLAIGRIIEYVRIQHFINLDGFKMSPAAKLSYIAIALIGLATTSSTFGGLY